MVLLTGTYFLDAFSWRAHMGRHSCVHAANPDNLTACVDFCDNFARPGLFKGFLQRLRFPRYLICQLYQIQG